jgi:HD-like signal output (HDOD) protein/DNA-binding NarL/FixJ family response regulator
MMKPEHLILVVDDDQCYRESLKEVLESAGYLPRIAQSAPEALEIASRQTPALALLDVAMPGIDGIQLLRYFRSRHVFRQMPVILLSAGVGRDAVQAARELGVRDVLIKSKFTAAELFERIELRLGGPSEVVRNPELAGEPRSARSSQAVPRAPNSSVFAPSSGSGFSGEPAPMRPETEIVRPSGMRSSTPTPEMIEAIGKLRALPRITTELLRLAASPDSSLSDLESLVKGDPVVAARILQAANSAAFLRGGPTTQLDEAVRVLGFTHVAEIVSRAAVLTEEDLEGQVGSDLRSLWRHCLAAATFAERMTNGADRATAYLGGLLHDLPSLFALQYLGSDWLPWRAHAQIKGLALHQALSEALGCPLERLSEQILSAYRIPADVAVSIQEYHEFFLAKKPREPGKAARRLDLAHNFAIAVGRFGTELSAVRTVRPDELPNREVGDIFNASDIQGLAAREDESGLGEPEEDEIPPIHLPLVLWRDPRWASPDPVQSFLGQIADCLHVDRFDDLNVPERQRVAMVEPGSFEWVRLGPMAPILVLHRNALPEDGVPPGVDALRMPVPLALLVQRLTRKPARI